MRLVGYIVFYFLSLSAAFGACEGRIISEQIHGVPVCVPSIPKRIVTLDPLLTLGMLHELEVPIIGVSKVGIQDVTLRQAVEQASVADVGHPYQPSMERILALQPDLIIGASYAHEQIYDQLSKIAPTLLIDHIDWKDHYRLIAEITGQEAKAARTISAYEERVQGIKARIPDDLIVSVVRVAPVGFQVYLQGPASYAPYAVLHEAGVKRSDFEVTADQTVLKRPDWEEISALTGHKLLYVVVSGINPENDEELAQKTLANPLWQALPAVRAGRAHRVDRQIWMGFHGVASANRVLDDIERYILSAP